jgi:hypothetical protein
MGMVLLCGVGIGLADVAISWRNGVRHVAVAHLVGTALLAATGAFAPDLA